MAANRWLTAHGIKFERQVEVELQPGFEFEGKKIRKISYRADFKILADPDRVLWVDMKGFETPEFKLKWKLLLFRGIHVHKVKSVSDLVSLIQKLGFWQNQHQNQH